MPVTQGEFYDESAAQRVQSAWQALGVSWQEISFLLDLFPFRVFGTNFSVLSFQPQTEVSLLYVNQQTAVRVEIAHVLEAPVTALRQSRCLLGEAVRVSHGPLPARGHWASGQAPCAPPSFSCGPLPRSDPGADVSAHLLRPPRESTQTPGLASLEAGPWGLTGSGFPVQTARKAGPRGRSGRSARPPVGRAPSSGDAPVTSPATPAWGRPSRRGPAAWASATTAVSVRPARGSRGPSPRSWPPAAGALPCLVGGKLLGGFGLLSAEPSEPQCACPLCASPAGRRLEPLVTVVLLLGDLRRRQRHPHPPLQLTGAADGGPELQGERP